MRPHTHCPNDCGDHPQPFSVEGKEYCGRCWVVYKEISEMVPCTSEYCGGEDTALMENEE